MRYPDFGKCQIRSIYLAHQLRKEGLQPSVLYGIFRPQAPRYTWDERWQKAEGNEFVHFWIGFPDSYYDYSCFQFGEKEPIKTQRSDTRYEELGYYDITTQTVVNTGNIMVEWESYHEKEGVPVMRLVPIFV